MSTEAEKVVALTTAGKPFSVDGSNMAVALPEGYCIEHLEKLQAAPNRVVEHLKVREVADLLAYLDRFRASNTVAFADWQAGKIQAIIDFHDPNGHPAFTDHTCTFCALPTASWDAWRKAHDKPMGQVAFGRFLEERAVEIIEPDAASVVELCMNLDAIKRVSFRSAVRLSDGYRQLHYVEDNEAKGGVRVPEIIKISVPVFEGQEPVTIPVRLRYRIEDGKLSLWVTFDNIDNIISGAFERCIDAFSVDMPDVPLYRSIL